MSLLAGVRAFVDGARLVRAPGLGRYLWLPALVSLVVVAAGLIIGLGYLGAFGEWLETLLPEWLGWLALILVPLLYVLGVLVGVWLFGLFAALIAGPFMGDLALAAERREFGHAPPAAHGPWAGLAHGLKRELRKLLYYLPRLLGVLVLSLIPVLNLVAPLLWFALGAWLLAVQFCDYPTENRGLSLQHTLALLRANRAAAFGFGAVATLTLAIPLVNFLMIPVAVVGGALLWRRLQPATT